MVAQFLYVGAQVGTWSYMIPYVISATGVGERSRGLLAYGGAGGFYGRPFLLGVAVALCACRTFAWDLCSAQCGHLWRGRVAAGLVGRLLAGGREFSDVDDVSIDLSRWERKGLGTRTKTGAALIVMAIIGGALITLAMGRVADRVNIATSYLVPAACFIGIALYAWLFSQTKADEAAA